ncbi:flavin reductase family protein [Telmatospirillum siberiense]|uniref:Flavin reductase n=1 Tax=Telmatospirillum siberiense TaxID=382514 RepID=A0A2N3PYP9_9PROT|nr:flavin reductase family protein [Telmatospirillum siberiense]PKU25546.1 flavin reductase [Telmatospirillum siberiense]
MSFNPRTFRNALGCFPTGVTIVTSLKEDGAPIGVTISSFSSLSLSPPLVLFCLDDRNSELDSFLRAGHFAINVLSDAQQDLSDRFASRKSGKWDGVSWEPWNSGVPILNGCLANFECALVAVHDGGDHRIFVGQVERMRQSEEGKPLIYWRGNYVGLSDSLS